MKRTTNYGNWVPATILRISYGCAAAFLLAFLFSQFYWHNFWAAVITGLLVLVAAVIAFFMQVCHHTFSFEGGGLMGEIHQFLIDHLNWNGQGTLLDIGCGAGALTNRCAKQFPEATLCGMDYWGMGWDYAKEQCERNAEIEGVADRVTFSKGDASKLDFADESFDAGEQLCFPRSEDPARQAESGARSAACGEERRCFCIPRPLRQQSTLWQYG